MRVELVSPMLHGRASAPVWVARQIVPGHSSRPAAVGGSSLHLSHDSVLLLAGGSNETGTLAEALATAGIGVVAVNAATAVAALRSGSVAAVIMTGEAILSLELQSIAAIVGDRRKRATIIIAIEFEEVDTTARLDLLGKLGNLVRVRRPTDDRLVVDLVRAASHSAENSGRSRAIIELSEVIPFVATADGTVSDMDDRFFVATGLPHGTGMSINGDKDRAHPDDRERVRQVQLHAQRTGVPLDYEYRGRIADGSYRWWQMRAAPVMAADGRVMYWNGILSDIHDRKVAEDQLRASDVLHRHSIDLSNLVVWTAFADGRIETIGDRLFEITGMTREQFSSLGRFRDWLHPDDARLVVKKRRRSLAQQMAVDFEFRMRVTNGGYHWWRCRTAPQRNDAGEVVRWYGTLESVDALRCAEKELRTSEQLHRYSLELSNLFAWTGSPEGPLFSISPGIFKSLGLTRAMTASMRPMSLLHPDDAAVASAAFRAGSLTGAGADFRHRLRRADGSYSWWRLRAAPLRGKDGEIIRWYGTLENIDAMVRAEGELEHLRTEMLYLSRLSAMGTMASTLAHELNQPLAAVTNYIGGCRRLLDENVTDNLHLVRDAMANVAASALQAGEVVRKLRQQVTRSDQSWAHQSVASLIDDACGIALINARELDISVRIELDPEVSTVYVDNVQVQQVLISFLRHAVESVSGTPMREIVVATRLVDGYCAIDVSDSGPGSTLDRAARSPDSVEPRRRERFGIGLSISRTIAEAHGGRIEQADTDLGGARFTVVLPIGMQH